MRGETGYFEIAGDEGRWVLAVWCAFVSLFIVLLLRSPKSDKTTLGLLLVLRVERRVLSFLVSASANAVQLPPSERMKCCFRTGASYSTVPPTGNSTFDHGWDSTAIISLILTKVWMFCVLEGLYRGKQTTGTI